MRCFDGFDSFPSPPGRVALAIGNFDGVHRGHQALLASVRAAARHRGAQSVVITFNPHPAVILAPQRAPVPLTTIDERLRLLASYEVDACMILRSEPALFEQSADEFLRRLVSACRPMAIIEGVDFRFGHNRAGTVETLRLRGPELGFDVVILEPIVAPELPDSPTISSTAVRAALRAGDISRAATLLGRPYEIRGVVGKGDGRGAGIGFPTANLTDVQNMLPLEGVYSANASVDDSKSYTAVVNIGPQPTFDQPGVRVEAHLLDFAGDLRGKSVSIRPTARLRGQVRFASVDLLIEQIRRDIQMTRERSN